MDVSSSAPMTKHEPARRIGELCRLTGQFRLRSGPVSSSYFDKYHFECDPVLLDAVPAHLADVLPPSTEVLAGLGLGGVPVATALSLRTGLPVAFVRKVAKPHWTAKLAETLSATGRHGRCRLRRPRRGPRQAVDHGVSQFRRRPAPGDGALAKEPGTVVDALTDFPETRAVLSAAQEVLDFKTQTAPDVTRGGSGASSTPASPTT